MCTPHILCKKCRFTLFTPFCCKKNGQQVFKCLNKGHQQGLWTLLPLPYVIRWVTIFNALEGVTEVSCCGGGGVSGYRSVRESYLIPFLRNIVIIESTMVVRFNRHDETFTGVTITVTFLFIYRNLVTGNIDESVPFKP